MLQVCIHVGRKGGSIRQGYDVMKGTKLLKKCPMFGLLCGEGI